MFHASLPLEGARARVVFTRQLRPCSTMRGLSRLVSPRQPLSWARWSGCEAMPVLGRPRCASMAIRTLGLDRPCLARFVRPPALRRYFAVFLVFSSAGGLSRRAQFILHRGDDVECGQAALERAVAFDAAAGSKWSEETFGAFAPHATQLCFVVATHISDGHVWT